jgi:hypothetical protein
MEEKNNRVNSPIPLRGRATKVGLPSPNLVTPFEVRLPATRSGSLLRVDADNSLVCTISS